ncbi:MAG: hypothetical protein IPG64_27125 [Haliea sp.]|nr:hypothetical protein [Haliea sp.]
MELGQIVATIIGLIIGAALIYPLMAARLHHAKDSLALVIANHEKEIGRLKESGLTLVTYPYKEEHGKDGVIFDERRVEIGYKYQLFVNGTPCFQPHIVATDTLTKKDINGERIEYALQRATDMVLQLSELHPAIKALKSGSDVNATVRRMLSKHDA